MIKPTIGRKVWFRPNGTTSVDAAKPLSVLHPDQALDATITYVWSDVMVNLLVLDHYGNPHRATSVTLVQEGNHKPGGMYCEWMPYQVGQTKAAEAAKTESPAELGIGSASAEPKTSYLETFLKAAAEGGLQSLKISSEDFDFGDVKFDGPTTDVSFGYALEALEGGAAIRRKCSPVTLSLNKGSHDFTDGLNASGELINSIDSQLFESGGKGTITRLPSINSYDGSVILNGWIPSAADLFAQDWEIVS